VCVNDAAGARSDDELYNLGPFIPEGSSTVEVVTRNPSNDDNIFLVLLYLNPPGTVEVEGGGPGDDDLMCEDLDEFLADLILNSPLLQFLPAFTQAFFIQFFLAAFQQLINLVQSGQLTADGIANVLQNLAATSTQLGNFLTPDLIEAIVEFVEVCADE
jgi:hypothetical protein